MRFTRFVFAVALLLPVRLVGQGVQPVGGTTASGVADGGNPVKVGGVFNTTQPTVANGQRVDAQFTSRGALIIATGTEVPHTICDSGCASPADSSTGSTALGAANAVITVVLAGNKGVAFQLQSAGTGVYTVTPQCSFDGGTIYNANGYIQDPVTGVVTLTATIASAQATTDYPVMCPQGSSHAQMKVTSYTSGTANWLARSTAITWPSVAWGVVTTTAPSYTTGLIAPASLTTAGALRVDNSGVTQPVSGTITANQGGVWTVQPGNTQNTTAWLTVESRPATGTVTTVVASAASVSLLASNAARRGAAIFNDSTTNVRIKFGSTASATSFTAFLGPQGFWALPFPAYTGAIDAIWDSATGNARVTETQ